MSKKTTGKSVMVDIGILCALTEAAPTPEEIVEPNDDDNEAEDYEAVPVGWVQIRVIRRGVNPDYVRYITAKEESINAAYAQAEAQAEAQHVTPTDEEKAGTTALIRAMVDAQYHAILRDTPKLVVSYEDVWVSPPERNAQVAAELEKLGRGLGLGLGVTKEGEA